MAPQTSSGPIFEGSEKRLEISFNCGNCSPDNGLRHLAREDIDNFLDKVSPPASLVVGLAMVCRGFHCFLSLAVLHVGSGIVQPAIATTSDLSFVTKNWSKGKCHHCLACLVLQVYLLSCFKPPCSQATGSKPVNRIIHLRNMIRNTYYGCAELQNMVCNSAQGVSRLQQGRISWSE